MRRRIFKDLESYLQSGMETQEEFARVLGVSQAYISQIRNGKRSPTLRLAWRIADRARIPIETLIATDDRV